MTNSTNFTSGTVVTSDWLNDVDRVIYEDAINVKNYGAIGNGGTDDTSAIQTCINENPGKMIYFPTGSYKVTNTITITADNTKLIGSSRATIVQYTADIDTVKFAPTTAGTTSAFLNTVEFRDINIFHVPAVSSVATEGAGVRFVQCNGYTITNVTISDAYEGLVVQGGQFGTISKIKLFASSGPAAITDSALLKFKDAPYGAGLFQPCYTVSVNEIKSSASKLRDACILVSNVDGLSFDNIYLGNGKVANIIVKNERDNSYISSLTFSNSYIDCINSSSTPYGIYIPDDGFTNSKVYHVYLDNSCTIGNGTIGILVRKPRTYDVNVRGNIINFTSWGVDCQGSTSYTKLDVDATFTNCGTSGAGGAIRANTLRSLRVSGTFSDNQVVNLVTSGTIGRGVISSCVNNTNVADWGDSATWTNGVVVAGNQSAYTGTGTTWLGSKFKNQAVDATTTLDWYEEGTFIPTVTFGGNAVGVTYATQEGTFTRIGNRVLFSLNIILTSKGSSTGNLVVTGLPYNAASTLSSCSCSVRLTLVNPVTCGDEPFFAVVQSGSTTLRIDKMGNSVGYVIQLTEGDLTNSSDIRLSGQYMV